MEPSRTLAPRRAPEPGDLERLQAGAVGPVVGLARELGHATVFGLRAVIEIGGLWRHASEVLRQAGILIIGSAAVIWLMQFVIGMQCGLEATYALRGYGASSYAGVFTAWCTVREMAPQMLGYILAAKVGCGLVAEIGSMRINDELDAMDALGMNTMQYIVSARLVAAWIVLPFIFIIGMAFQFLAEYLVVVVQIGEVSEGAWSTIHWLYQNPLDLFFSTAKAMIFGTTIVLVGMYYGWYAGGGPVGVGAATARSMILNLILLHVLAALLTMVFWGLNPNTPVGG